MRKALGNSNHLVGSVTEEIPRVQRELALRDVGQTEQGICLERGGNTVWGDPVPCGDTRPDLKELKVT